MAYAGIVLAGGAARRLSGVDKPALTVGGKPLLAKALAALADADPVIVVGPERPGFGDVLWTRESSPGTGPVAAVAAGLALVRTEVVVVLAGDLAGVRKSTVERLVAALGSAPGAVLVDAAGERQWLLGAWRTEALRGALPEKVENASLRRALGGLELVEVAEEPGESDDIDTPEDLDRFS
ncbi:molybdenum cofactor guanylyltransferase [Amycolatopsis sp. lyj-84]|uniref:molybdenum cofactor guanylyltransferase n=1 Tax=Amycolatopsis sp. lyj-84 TaxID=2789284 RepID=UPI00397C34AA